MKAPGESVCDSQCLRCRRCDKLCSQCQSSAIWWNCGQWEAPTWLSLPVHKMTSGGGGGNTNPAASHGEEFEWLTACFCMLLTGKTWSTLTQYRTQCRLWTVKRDAWAPFSYSHGFIGYWPPVRRDDNRKLWIQLVVRVTMFFLKIKNVTFNRLLHNFFQINAKIVNSHDRIHKP